MVDFSSSLQKSCVRRQFEEMCRVSALQGECLGTRIYLTKQCMIRREIMDSVSQESPSSGLNAEFQDIQRELETLQREEADVEAKGTSEQDSPPLPQTQKTVPDSLPFDIANIRDIPFSADRSGVVTFVGAQVAELGYAPEEIVSRNLMEFIAEEDRERIAAEFEETMAHGAEFPSRFRLLDKDGSSRWYEDFARAVRNEAGEVAGVMGVLRDVEEMKRNEDELEVYRTHLEEIAQKRAEELVASTEQFMGLADQFPSMLFIYRSKRVVYANEKCVTMLGVSTDEICTPGFKLSSLVSGQHKKLIETAQTGMDNGEEISPFELNLLPRSGPPIDVIVTTNRGQFEGSTATIGIMTEITDRKRAEHQLIESEEKFRSIAEESPSIIFISRDDQIVYANPACEELLGYADEELVVGKFSYSDFVSPDGQDDVRRALHDQDGAGPRGRHEHELLARDGRTLDVVATMRQIEFQGSSSILITVTDLSELKGAEQELKSHSDLEQLITAVSLGLIKASPHTVDAEINTVMRALGEFTKVDRTILLEFAEEGTRLNTTHEWCSDGVDIQVDELQNIDVRHFKWSMDQIRDGRIVYVPDVNDMPPEAEAEQSEFHAEDLKTTIMVPLICGPNTLGFMGFGSVWEKKVWDDKATSLIRIVASSIANALERKRAGESLALERHLLESLMKNSRDRVYFKNRDGCFLRINRCLAELFGLDDPADAVGKTDFDFFDQDHATHLFEDERCMLDTGEPIIDKEEKEIWPDGKEIWVSTTKMPLRNSKETIIGTFGVSRDIGARKMAENALRDSETKLRTIVTNTQAIIFMLDEDGIFTLSEGEGLSGLGLKAGQVVGQSALEIYKEYPEVVADIRAALRGELRRATREVQGVIFDLFYSPYRPARDAKAGVIGMAVDITDRVQGEEKRQELECKMMHVQKLESLGVLAGGIAHDFNNLLMGVLGHASLALMELPPESPAQQSVQRIETAALRAAELTSQMLAYAGMGKFVKQDINLSSLVEEMAHLLEVSISDKIEIEYRFAGNLPSIQADAAQIRQVVMNLITNGSDAIADESGKVIVETSTIDCDAAFLSATYFDNELAEGEYVCLKVTDTGCGMDEETSASVFDPFFTTKITGRGLGLAAVLGIVRSHGGAIKVDSEVGRGTCFTVVLPASTSTAGVADVGTEEKAEKFRGSGTAMLIDDDETVCLVTRQMLESLGFSVVTAGEGAEAIEQFEEHADSVSVIFLDVAMPTMSGDEILRRIREIKDDVPVILLSGYSEQVVVDEFHDLVIAGFLQKPYNLKMLKERLGEVLG